MHETHALGTSELVLGHDYQAGTLYWARFLGDVVSRGLPHERFIRWDTSASSLAEVLEYTTHSSKLAWGSAALLDLEGATGCIAAANLRNLPRSIGRSTRSRESSKRHERRAAMGGPPGR